MADDFEVEGEMEMYRIPDEIAKAMGLEWTEEGVMMSPDALEFIKNSVQPKSVSQDTLNHTVYFTRPQDFRFPGWVMGIAHDRIDPKRFLIFMRDEFVRTKGPKYAKKMHNRAIQFLNVLRDFAKAKRAAEAKPLTQVSLHAERTNPLTIPDLREKIGQYALPSVPALPPKKQGGKKSRRRKNRRATHRR